MWCSILLIHSGWMQTIWLQLAWSKSGVHPTPLNLGQYNQLHSCLKKWREVVCGNFHKKAHWKFSFFLAVFVSYIFWNILEVFLKILRLSASGPEGHPHLFSGRISEWAHGAMPHDVHFANNFCMKISHHLFKLWSRKVTLRVKWKKCDV